MLERRNHMRACVLAAAAAVLLAAPAAHGAPITTQYFTISISDPPPQSSLPNPQTRFLASINRQKGVPIWLQRYEPGVISQHWTPVYRKWPYPDVVGTSSVSDLFGFITDCIGLTRGPGCKFSNTVASPSLKFANRYSARCITVSPVSVRPGVTYHRLVQEACAEGGDPMNRQTWSIAQRERDLQADREVKLVQTYAGKDRCITIHREPYPTADPCATPAQWWQTFRILKVAAVTCEYIGSRDGYCGMPPPTVVPRN